MRSGVCLNLISAGLMAGCLLAALALLAMLERRMTLNALPILISEEKLPLKLSFPVGDQLALERSLARLDGQLARDGLTFHSEQPLLAAVAALAVGQGESFPADVGDLVVKSFPERGPVIHLLVECFFHYQRAETTSPPSAGTALEDALAQQVGLQAACFGESVASRLFGQYRRMYESLGASDRVTESPVEQHGFKGCDVTACGALRDHVDAW